MTIFAKLIAKNVVGANREISLTAFPLRLGRRADADVCIDDRWVSRDHCEIDRVDGVLFVRDLGSKHGTYVNGRAVAEAPLKSGDTLSIGLSRFLVQYACTGAAAEPISHFEALVAHAG
jgi:pSer/pThr/pTyr-binding forkhead associated (FHA) protein